MKNYTKGEWKITYANSDDRSGGQWYEVGPATIQFSYGCNLSQLDMAAANAKIISQSPNMFEFIKELNETLKDAKKGRGLSITEESFLIKSEEILSKLK